MFDRATTRFTLYDLPTRGFREWLNVRLIGVLYRLINWGSRVEIPAGASFAVSAGDVRGDETIRLAPQRVVRGQRFRLGHVQPRRADMAGTQRR
mgnify:CR=1 FL=1